MPADTFVPPPPPIADVPPPLTAVFYWYFTTPLQRAREALVLLATSKERMIQQGWPGIEKLFEYVDPVLALLKYDPAGDPVAQGDQAAIATLGSDTIAALIAAPSDQDRGEEVFEQLLFLAGATGLLKDVAAHTPEKLRHSLATFGTDFYTDVLSAYTLHGLLTDAAQTEYIPVVVAYLQDELRRAPKRVYDWDGALVFSLALRVAWTVFPSLNDLEEGFL